MHNTLGTLTQEAGDLAAAEQAYLTAIRSDDREPGYQLNLARLLAEQGNHPATHAVQTYPISPAAKELIAEAYRAID